MRNVSHYGPSFCVKFHGDNNVFSACGPFLQVHNYRTNKPIHRVRIFQKNKIHGFSFSHNGENIVIYGGKSVTIVEVNKLMATDDVTNFETLASEWIVAGEFNYTDNQIYLLTCYNLVLIVDLHGKILQKKSLINERSILYSGSIKVLPDKVYVNAGTVMGGILIWDLFTESKIHNLTGHEGSIFYITVSNNGQLIASCSDDRSIRLWDMTSGKEVAVGWGHTARIWNLKFFDNDTRLISVSEDCTCRTWDIVPINDTDDKLNLVVSNVFEVHLIKNVWGVDVEENDMIAATTGNDGRLKLIDLKQSSRYGDENETFNLADIGKEFNIDIKKDETIKGFSWFTFGLVAITSLGKIIKYDLSNKVWTLIEIDERLLHYSFTHNIRDFNGNNVIVFSNNKADLLLLRFSQDGKTVTAKTALHIDGLSKTTNCMVISSDDNTFLLTFESPNPRDSFKIIRFNMNTLDIEKEYNFKKPDNFVSSCLEVFDNFVLVGSRFSTIAIFDLTKESIDDYNATLIRRVNPGDTMTSIKLVETKDNKHLLSVTNRDGYYNFITLAINDSNEIEHEVIHSNKFIKGSLEGAYYNTAKEYITYGFKSSLFYMYNEQNGYEIVSQVCGGAHRQWNLSPLSDADKESFMLVFVQSSQLHFRRIYKPLVPETLVNGLHGREIRDLSICPIPRSNGDHLFVTGSEDTSIRLNSVNVTTGNIKTHWSERKHVSGLQKLRFINDKLMISCSAKEELFLWEINDQFQSNPYIHVKKTLPVSSDNPDLRIMDFDIKFINQDDFILNTVYSDSAVKVWYYEKKSNTFKLLLSMRYKTCCIFNTALVDFHESTFLVLAPTDGYLAIYNVTNIINSDGSNVEQTKLNPEITVRIHQSGIKCIDNYITEKGQWEIFTGGDDNGVGASVFEIDNDTKKLVLIKHKMIPDVVSSTVTSCQVFNKGKKLLTTSVDQIVRVWDISQDDDLLKLEDQKYTTIADTGSCDILPIDKDENIVLLGGVGISMWSL